MPLDNLGDSIRPGLKKLTLYCCTEEAPAIVQAGLPLLEGLVGLMPDAMKHFIIFGKGTPATRRMVSNLKGWRRAVLQTANPKIIQLEPNDPSTPRRPAKRPAA